MTNKISLNSIVFKQLYSFLTVALYGCFFFREGLDDHLSPLYMPAAFLLIWQTLFVIFCLLLSNKFIKVISILLFLLNALVFYFMYAYRIPIDKIMLMNALQTDTAEAAELLNMKIVYCLFFLGILPAVLISLCRIIPCSFKSSIRAVGISLAVILLTAGLSGHSTNIMLHRFKYLMDYLPPVNYIAGGTDTLIEILTPRPPLQRISQDITPPPATEKPNLIVFVVGETSRAANFSLNGYSRPTNEPLEPYLNNIVYYPDVKSCGTATAVSVPCMFLSAGRKDYKIGSEIYTENVLDAFEQAGYKILWRDNDGGCKNICDRVRYEEPCDSKSCLDEILLQNLQEKITGTKGNRVIILHTRGSHGPSYHIRYDEPSSIYAPICTQNTLWNCSHEELVNVYDNTIHYVSRFLAQTIDILTSLQDQYNPVLFYTSDHGESLGENGQYLHAAAYNMAPAFQTEVPMLIWLPDNNGYGLDLDCLREKASDSHSHDNIFHSLLGLGELYGHIYKAELDIFSGCRR